MRIRSSSLVLGIILIMPFGSRSLSTMGVGRLRLRSSLIGRTSSKSSVYPVSSSTGLSLKPGRSYKRRLNSLPGSFDLRAFRLKTWSWIAAIWDGLRTAHCLRFQRSEDHNICFILTARRGHQKYTSSFGSSLLGVRIKYSNLCYKAIHRFTNKRACSPVDIRGSSLNVQCYQPRVKR